METRFEISIFQAGQEQTRVVDVYELRELNQKFEGTDVCIIINGELK